MSHNENWFIWGCFIEQENLPPAFIYGYAAQTFKEISDSFPPKAEKLVAGRRVYFFQEIISPEDFNNRFTFRIIEVC